MRIQIIGGSGTGKSTLAKYIAAKENIAFIDTDTYLWKDKDFTVNVPLEKRFEMIEQDIEKHKDYVVAGSVFWYNKQGFHNKELTVYLYIDENIRQKRLYDREIERYGKEAFDMVDLAGNPTNDFLEWTKTFYNDKDGALPGTYGKYMLELESLETPFIEVDGNLEWDEKYKLIKDFYEQNCK